MAELNSIADRISSQLAPVLRKLQNVNISTLGTRTQILRIAVGTSDDWGQSEDDLKDCIVDRVIIKHPFLNKIQIFSKANEALQQAETSAIDLAEFMPIEIRIPFNGDPESKPVELLKGDIIVQVMKDEHGTKIPIIMQISRVFGQFSVSNLVSKTYEANLYRGTPQPNVMSAIQLYINSLT